MKAVCFTSGPPIEMYMSFSTFTEIARIMFDHVPTCMYFNPNSFTFGRDITFVYSAVETKKTAIEAEGKP